MHEYSQLAFLYFHETKDAMVDWTYVQLNTWIQSGKKVHTVRCDNAGENKKLEKTCIGEKWQLPLTFEYTSRATPQQNSIAERKIDTLASRTRSVLNGAKVPEAEKKHVFNECLNTVTQIDGLIVRKVNGKTATRYEHWCNTLPKFARHLREWGEAGVVTVRDIKTNKLTNKGRLCMFVGYATKHAGDCYRMYDPNT